MRLTFTGFKVFMEANYRIFTIILCALYNGQQLFKIYHTYINKLNLSLFQALERHNKSNSFQYKLDEGLYLGGPITVEERQFTVLLTFTASPMVDTGVVLKSSAVAEPVPALIVVCRTARNAHWILRRWTLIITFTATAIHIICFADSKSRALQVETRVYVYVEKKGSIF